MSLKSLRGPLCSAAVLGLSLGALAHEDDPKVLDRKPPYQGPGYRTGEWGRGGGLVLGTASETFEAHNVTLLSWLPLGDLGSPNNGNSCWGYTSPSGREYAL